MKSRIRAHANEAKVLTDGSHAVASPGKTVCRPASTHEHGFTLLELLVAIMVFAVMALMAYGGLDVVLHDRDSMQESLQKTAKLQKALYRLETDLANVRPRPIRGPYGSAKPAFLATNGVVTFTRGGLSNPLQVRRSTLERVGYTVDNDTLVRLRWRVLDQAQDSKPVRTGLLKGVTQISWRFTASDGQSYAQWPPPNATNRANIQPPQAAEVTLQTKGWGKLRLIVPLQSGTLNQGAGTGAGTGGSRATSSFGGG